MDNTINTCDEETPLLKSEPAPTPLPKLQIGILLLFQFCELLSSSSISPYINELVSTLDIIGGDEQKIGHYAGLIESLFYLTEALTIFQWSRISDRVGRKSVLMTGLLGMMFSTLSFGLSRTFAKLVISRCLCGLLNGNIGVVKSAMGELTDTTNRAEAFASIAVVWALGCTIGPLLGGTLARPSDRFPLAFTWKFWGEYPYFLPCLATSSFMLLTLVITGLFFKETTNRWRSPTRSALSSSEVTPTHGFHSEHVSFRGLLTFPVVISVANYAALSFLIISVNALLPLFFHMSLDMGGLGLQPAPIGYLMGVYGFGTGFFQVFFFPKLARAYGIRRVYVTSILTFVPVFMMFPIISLVANRWGFCWVMWGLIAAMFCILFVSNSGFGCVFIYVTESAPNRQSLGATNGLAQTTTSLARGIGPALATSSFSISVQRNILGGYGVYALFVGFSLLALLLGTQLPDQVWTTKSEDEWVETSDSDKNV